MHILKGLVVLFVVNAENKGVTGRQLGPKTGETRHLLVNAYSKGLSGSENIDVEIPVLSIADIN